MNTVLDKNNHKTLFINNSNVLREKKYIYSICRNDKLVKNDP